MLRKMRAMYFENHGKTSDLKYDYVPTPQPGPHEVLVQVKAVALNHLDLWTLYGAPGMKVTLPHILGCDISGVVVETGKKARHIKTGKPVVIAPGVRCGKCESCLSGWDSLCPQYKILGFQINGGYAEFVSVPAENVIPVSDRLSFEEWASIPLVFLTAWHMLVTHAKIQKKETVLIHAAGSGVGSAAIQIAKLFKANVITTVGHDAKIRRAKQLGADLIVNYRKKDFQAEVFKYTNGRGADIVIEHIGPETFTKSLQSLAKRGRLITCGVTSGPFTDLNLRHLFSRQLSIQGSYMGGIHELKRVIRRVETKKLHPVVDKIFPLREAKQALDRMIARENFGKIVLSVV